MFKTITYLSMKRKRVRIKNNQINNNKELDQQERHLVQFSDQL